MWNSFVHHLDQDVSLVSSWNSTVLSYDHTTTKPCTVSAMDFDTPGKVDITAGDSGRIDPGAPAVWNCLRRLPAGTVSRGSSLTCPTGASIDHNRIAHNVCGHTSVSRVSGGPGLLRPSSLFSSNWLAARHSASPCTQASKLRSSIGIRVPNDSSKTSSYLSLIHISEPTRPY